MRKVYIGVLLVLGGLSLPSVLAAESKSLKKAEMLEQAAENWLKAGRAYARLADSNKELAAAHRNAASGGEEEDRPWHFRQAGDAETGSAALEMAVDRDLTKAASNYAKAALEYRKAGGAVRHVAARTEAMERAAQAREDGVGALSRALAAHESAALDYGPGNASDTRKEAQSWERAAALRERLASTSYFFNMGVKPRE